MRLVLLAFGLLVGTTACSGGTQFGTASGGSSGTAGSGAGGGSGAAGTGGGAAAGGAGGAIAMDGGTTDGGTTPACTGGSCPADQVCVGCGADAKCVPSTDAGVPIGPVCGCDGLTYWDAPLARKDGEALQHMVKCPDNVAVKCQNTACPTGSYCNKMRTQTASVCDPAIGADTCWALPDSCPDKPKGASCIISGATNCSPACSLVKAQVRWYGLSSNSCP